MPTLAPTGNFTPTSIRAIVDTFKAQLLLRGVCTAAQFIATADESDNVPHLTGNFDVVFGLGAETPDVRVIDAAGRTVNKRQRDCTLTIRNQLLLDVVGSDAASLYDAAFGIIRIEDAVCDALELFQPQDEAGNWLVTEPVRLGRLGKARREKGQPEWLNSSWELSLSYVRLLSMSLT